MARTWEKIEEAMEGRRFAVDLDTTKRGHGGKGAAAEFETLFEAANGFENYYGELADLPHAIPVLRITNGAAPDLAAQLSHIEALDRGVVLRIQHGFVSSPSALLEQILNAVDDLAILIDLGWSTELLTRQAWGSAIIAKITEILPGAEIVVAGSSFPSSFTNVGERAQISVAERDLHDSLVRQHNAASIVYGDWGSTRPPATEKVPMRNTPRIDLPELGYCTCFRKVGSEGYQDIARRLIADPAWPSDLKVWGTYTIECTAAGIPGAIRSPGTPAAARINMHMHRQATSASPSIVSDGDEPFTD